MKLRSLFAIALLLSIYTASSAWSDRALAAGGDAVIDPAKAGPWCNGKLSLAELDSAGYMRLLPCLPARD